jgi:hypothetical protein
MKTKKTNYLFRIFLFSALALIACNTMSHFDQYAYTQSTSIKVDALNLIDLATEDYKTHEKEVKEVDTKVQKIYEYEKNRPKNEFTTRQWEILKDTTKDLYGGFIAMWRKNGKVGKTFIENKKAQIGKAFDQISQLESKKIKPSEVK